MTVVFIVINTSTSIDNRTIFQTLAKTWINT